MRPSRMTFLTCLLAAPALFAIIPGLFTMMGDYASRFGFVGNLCLLVCLPAWLLVFPFLGMRAARRGESGARPFVFMALAANVASLVIYPIAVALAEALGGDLSGMLREAFLESEAAAAVEAAAKQANDAVASDIPMEELTLVSAGLLTGLVVFFVGLFVMPILGALFGWVAGKLGLVREA